ncbi:flagellar assembly protein FliH [Sphingomonas sanguinis]|uniref:FliH/SctL family protein n=1 Tax=Sphingomonas sp. LC-1 TaxID=3110957 RepID=UPI0021BA6982|nr:flagellar assembly protein FliH [Sphingomonas sp. LC-1]MCT8001121.1 flagellar assembly protein FliH [Sphingomonas sp. LC-1]
MSDFVAGFSARQNAAAAALQQAFAPPGAFARSDLSGMAMAPGTGVGVGFDMGADPVSFRPRSPMPGGDAPRDPDMQARPRHFHPANPSQDPTQGWDPFAACEESAEPAADPIAAARAAGHAEGYAQGVEDATREFQALTEAQSRDEQLIGGISHALSSRIDRDMMANQLRHTVMALVTRLVGETGIDADRLTSRIEGAIDLLAEAHESAMLRVHPDDVAALEGRLPQTIFPVGDPTVERGGFVLESASTIVEDGPRLWLDQLAAVIDKVPVPSC